MVYPTDAYMCPSAIDLTNKCYQARFMCFAWWFNLKRCWCLLKCFFQIPCPMSQRSEFTVELLHRRQLRQAALHLSGRPLTHTLRFRSFGRLGSKTYRLFFIEYVSREADVAQVVIYSEDRIDRLSSRSCHNNGSLSNNLQNQTSIYCIWNSSNLNQSQ